jgi:hypothetical protein
LKYPPFGPVVAVARVLDGACVMTTVAFAIGVPASSVTVPRVLDETLCAAATETNANDSHAATNPLLNHFVLIV